MRDFPPELTRLVLLGKYTPQPGIDYDIAPPKPKAVSDPARQIWPPKQVPTPINPRPYSIDENDAWATIIPEGKYTPQMYHQCQPVPRLKVLAGWRYGYTHGSHFWEKSSEIGVIRLFRGYSPNSRWDWSLTATTGPHPPFLNSGKSFRTHKLALDNLKQVATDKLKELLEF